MIKLKKRQDHKTHYENWKQKICCIGFKNKSAFYKVYSGSFLILLLAAFMPVYSGAYTAVKIDNGEWSISDEKLNEKKCRAKAHLLPDGNVFLHSE